MTSLITMSSDEKTRSGLIPYGGLPSFDGRSAGRAAARRVIASLDRTNLKQRERDFAKAMDAATKRRDRQRHKAVDAARRRNRKIDAEFSAAHDVAWEAFTGRKA